MGGNNGIARAPNGTIYVASSLFDGLSILEEQTDNTLVLIDNVPTGKPFLNIKLIEINLIVPCADRGIDNISIDSKGYVWAAGQCLTCECALSLVSDTPCLTCSISRRSRSGQPTLQRPIHQHTLVSSSPFHQHQPQGNPIWHKV